MTATASDRFFTEWVPYVRKFGECRADPKADLFHGKKDRPWWPMRYFMGDDILAAWVYRIRNRDRCEVGLFLAEDHQRFVKDSGMKGGLIFLLTQTLHLTGKMEVHFVGPRPGQAPTIDSGYEAEIPQAIRRYAAALGVVFAQPRTISDAEGRQLYARMSGFTEPMIAKFRHCGIDITRACFVVNRDIWSFEHVEYLLQHAYSPQRLFEGGLSPLHRMAFQRDQLVLRTAIFEERFRIVLEQFTDGEVPKKIDGDWVTATRRRYSCDQDIGLRPLGREPLWFKAGTTFEVNLTPRTSQGYVAFHADDAGLNRRERLRLVAVSKDFEWTGSLAAARTNAVYLPIHDTLAELDAEIDLRLLQAVSTRSELSERHQ